MKQRPAKVEAYPTWKKKAYIIIFEADTFWGKFFDVALLVCILMSVLVVMLESVQSLRTEYDAVFGFFEWGFTILFTLEYVFRIIVSEKSRKYIFSFFGLVDLLSVIPTFLSLFFVGAQSLLVIRSLRLLRIFRVFKLAHFLGEASQLGAALRASKAKITVFIVAVTILVTILGTVMYLVEGGQNGFTSIPRSIYWAIVTLTTVGYGDIAPHTVAGQAIASFIMILGYGIIAVPTGIVSSELAKGKSSEVDRMVCPDCKTEMLVKNARYCHNCGRKMM